MAKDSRSKLLESMGIDEETMLGNDKSSEEEREFERILEKALKENRIPSECIVDIQTEFYTARAVNFIEC